MKKLVLSLAILGFVAFGVISIQNVIASSVQTEMVNLDKDPKKDDTKKAADAKEVKSETKTTGSCEKSCASSTSCSDKSASAKECSDKSATAKACCDKEKAGCCSSSPDKK